MSFVGFRFKAKVCLFFSGDEKNCTLCFISHSMLYFQGLTLDPWVFTFVPQAAKSSFRSFETTRATGGAGDAAGGDSSHRSWAKAGRRSAGWRRSFSLSLRKTWGRPGRGMFGNVWSIEVDFLRITMVSTNIESLEDGRTRSYRIEAFGPQWYQWQL